MFLSEQEIKRIGLKSVGKNVLISDKAVFYRPERISIGDNVRIDDFCVLSNNITLGNNIHMTIYSCLLSSSNAFIEMQDFSGIGFRGMVFTETDDYSGLAMTNPTIPSKFRNCKEKSVTIGKHCVFGAGSIVMPGANIAEGTAIGIMSVIAHATKPWTIYFGNPARAMGYREKDLLRLEEEFLKEMQGKIP